MNLGWVVRDTRGTSIAELLVAAGLMGVVSLAIGTLYIDQVRNEINVQDSVALGDDLALFNDTVNNFLANTSQILSCGCPSACIYSPAVASNTCGVNACSDATLLQVVTEDSTDPSMDATAATNCYQGSVSGVAGRTHRGCKRLISLKFKAPTRVTSSGGLFTAGNAGELYLYDEVTAKKVVSLPGAYWVNCGQTGTETATTKSGQEFHLEFKAKKRASRITSSKTASLVDSWSIQDGNTYGFNLGVHRSTATTIPFRNINSVGIFYGKSVTTHNCVDDGDTASSGETCCSGYSRANGRCLAASSCVPAGTAALAGASSSCCSSDVDGSGVCR